MASLAVVRAISLASLTTYSSRGIINIPNTTIRPRLAASSYLNSAPLVWSFKHGPRKREVDLVEPVPAQCADLLTAGQVDVALIPVIEYQRIADITLVPEVCIASRQEVRSVILVSRHPDLKSIRSVALDESSRTSAVLVKIIFREFLGFEPQWISAPPNPKQMLADNDAALLIGDPAMTFPREEGLAVFDMATLWGRYTDLGFVFALWVIASDAPASAHSIDFREVRDEGLSRIEEIIDFYQPRLGLTRDELEAYLRENISFALDSELRAGLELFYKLAYQHELIPALKPLKL
jgi:chorismate dehydratase